MPRYVAFLRGINVGGHRLKMDRLRSLFEELGFEEVSTFIASGNVLFSSASEEVESLRIRVERHLARELGYEVPTFLRTPAQLAAVAAGDTPDTSSPDSHYVLFLHSAPLDSLREDLARLSSGIDTFEVGEREIHWRIRGKMSESPLFSGELDRVLRGIPNTSRNMNTLRRILARTGFS